MSLCIHGCVLLLLFVSLKTEVRSSFIPSGDIIEASIVDTKPKVSPRENQAPVKTPPVESQAQNSMPEIKQRAKQEQDALEQDNLAEIKLAKDQERKQLEVLKETEEKRKQQLKALQEKRKAEEQELKDKQKAQEAKEALAKKKAEALKRAEKAAEKAREEALARARSESEAAENAKWLSGEIEKYDAMMRQKINQCWIRPPGLESGLTCELYARLLPDGSVIHPAVKKSSGNVAFDQAAISALENASPLPVPNDPNLMDEFRQFNFKFSPPEET